MVISVKINHYNENSNSFTAEDCFVYLAERRKKRFAIDGIARESDSVDRRVSFH
jgi:hypothetical protein